MSVFDVFKKDAAEASAQTLDEVAEGAYPEGPVEVRDEDFDALVGRYPVVVVDCWAPWCMPCRMLGPVIDGLAKDYQGKIVFGKLNVDENPGTAGRLGVQSIPYLLVFKDGEQVDQLVGAMPRGQLEERLRPYIEE